MQDYDRLRKISTSRTILTKNEQIIVNTMKMNVRKISRQSKICNFSRKIFFLLARAAFSVRPIKMKRIQT